MDAWLEWAQVRMLTEQLEGANEIAARQVRPSSFSKGLRDVVRERRDIAQSERSNALHLVAFLRGRRRRWWCCGTRTPACPTSAPSLHDSPKFVMSPDDASAAARSLEHWNVSLD